MPGAFPPAYFLHKIVDIGIIMLPGKRCRYFQGDTDKRKI